MGDSCWVLVGDEMLWRMIVDGCWLVMKCRCFGDGSWLLCLVLRVRTCCANAPHVWCGW